MDRGFNPFALGLFPMATPPGYFEHWKNTVVAHDVGDWNLCARCLAAIRPYFSGAPAPLGITESQVPLLPQGKIPDRREAVKDAVLQAATGEDRGYVPGRDPLVDAMLSPIASELRKQDQKKKGGDDAMGCTFFVLLVLCSFGFHVAYLWGFWLSLLAGFGAALGLFLVGAFLWDLLFGKRKKAR
jgi:hypothetical protein